MVHARHKAVIRSSGARPRRTPQRPLTACWAGASAAAGVLGLLWALQPVAPPEPVGTCVAPLFRVERVERAPRLAPEGWLTLRSASLEGQRAS